VDDLVKFLRARLDEDEAEAKATADADAEFWADVKGDGTHFARHDPDRELRQVAFGRALLDRYAYCLEYGGVPGNEQLDPDTFEDYVLCPFAVVYSDHPDYLPEWKP
jgi:hypothetical protein